ncbi:hypothetical protein MRB53_030261 [Persea americana]|uniref:Uncharacterized protein n=1 Tax=Persea americana TaxID=3435 RepID=A0ACC2KKV6_PERAE|nr:hypothetical protein MRB53_030261 [Persea americana]
MELREVTTLSGLDVESAHEWLTVHADMATVFITADNKGEWILRQLPRIRVYRYKQLQKKYVAFSIADCSDLNLQ